MSSFPNILILMGDEWRFDHTGFAGHPVVRTPVLDALAADACRFTNAYTPSPICMPARQCFATGRYPRALGCERYGQDLPAGTRTFARIFAEHGYDTVACGKLHHTGSDQMQGWLRRVGMDHMIPPGSVGGLSPQAWKPSRKTPPPPGHWQGSQWNCVKEIRRAGCGSSPYAVWDEYATQGACHILRERFLDTGYDQADRERPLLMYLGCNLPHYPYLAEDEERFAYYLNRVEVPPHGIPFEHPWLSRCAQYAGPIRIGHEISEREYRRAAAAYCANIEATDARFGRVLDSMRLANENPDAWIIIFTADHGEMLGAHALWEKQKFFEESVRIPLFIRWPAGGLRPGEVSENVNLIDLFATMLELADLPAETGTDSRSLLELMRTLSGSSSPSWKNETLSQFGGKHLMIKSDALKYQYYAEDGPEVLFDLERDPSEQENFIDDDRYAKPLSGFRTTTGNLGFGFCRSAETSHENPRP